MKKYQPISCTFYDFIEHFATLKQKVNIKYLNKQDTLVSIESIILDTKQVNGEEFMRITGFNDLIRLDKIVSIEDKILADYNYC